MEHFKFLTNTLNAPDVGRNDFLDHAVLPEEGASEDPYNSILGLNLFVDASNLAASNLPEASYSDLEQAGRKNDSAFTHQKQENYDHYFQQSDTRQHDATLSPSRSSFVSSTPTLPTSLPSMRQPSASFIRDLPSHDYLLPPGGPLNFTLVEIISILPNWFRNGDMAIRFLNNHISASIHLAILQEHRELGITTEFEKARAREAIAYAYRKTMRSADPTWTKAKHTIPSNWNDGFMSVNAFLPDAARETSYLPPPSIAFKQLLVGVKKLPQGADAGDLTRALEYARYNTKFDSDGQTYELVFPDDIQMILNHIGCTYITMEHTDRYIVRRYADKARAAVNQKPRAEKTIKSVNVEIKSHLKKYQKAQPAFVLQTPQQNLSSALNFSIPEKSASTMPKIMFQPSTPTIIANVINKPSDVGFPIEARREIAESDNFSKQGSGKDFEYLLTPSPSPESKRGSNQMQGGYENPSELDIEVPVLKSKERRHAYPPDHLLRNCSEGREADDGSDLVRAVRYARQADQIATDWRVWDLDLILALISLDDIDQ